LRAIDRKMKSDAFLETVDGGGHSDICNIWRQNP